MKMAESEKMKSMKYRVTLSPRAILLIKLTLKKFWN